MTTHYLERPNGRIAYTVLEPAGAPADAPTVVLAPGMGDVRGVFRDVVGPLQAHGARVVTVDLRGHGESDTTFEAYDVPTIASDLEALIRHLGGPVALLGHSVSAGAATVVAARRPELVSSLVLVSPHLTAGGTIATLVARLMTQAIRRPIGGAFWTAYYRSLHKGRRADWFDEHVDAVRTSMRDGAHLVSFGRLARTLVTSHHPVPLGQVAAPTLVLHGALDPEFTDPAAELATAVSGLRAGAASVEGLLVPEAGHYPHTQRPDVVVPALLAHLALARA